MKSMIYVLFLLFSFKGFSQYPFEKFPALKYSKALFKIAYREKDSSRWATARYNHYLFKAQEGRNSSCYLSVYFKNKLIYKTVIDNNIFWVGDDYPLKMGDINGDGLLDFKITYPNASGSGLAGSIVWKLYLINKGRNKFEKFFFGDFYPGEKEERDFNSDGNFEIIAQHYVSYKWHAYWVFDIYSFINGTLVNVSNKYQYPIMTKAFQIKESYQITNKVSREKMQTFSKKLPDFYEDYK